MARSRLILRGSVVASGAFGAASAWLVALLVLLVGVLVAAVVWTAVNVRRIDREQRAQGKLLDKTRDNLADIRSVVLGDEGGSGDTGGTG